MIGIIRVFPPKGMVTNFRLPLSQKLGAFRVTKLGQNSAKTDFSKRNIYRFHHGVQWRTNGNKKSWVIRLLSPKGAQGPLQVVASIATRSSHYT